MHEVGVGEGGRNWMNEVELKFVSIAEFLAKHHMGPCPCPLLLIFFASAQRPPSVSPQPWCYIFSPTKHLKRGFFFYVFHPNVVHHFSITICPNFCCVYPSHHFPCAFYHFKYLIKWWKQVDGRRKVKNWNFFNPINPPQRNNLIKETAK